MALQTHEDFHCAFSVAANCAAEREERLTSSQKNGQHGWAPHLDCRRAVEEASLKRPTFISSGWRSGRWAGPADLTGWLAGWLAAAVSRLLHATLGPARGTGDLSPPRADIYYPAGLCRSAITCPPYGACASKLIKHIVLTAMHDSAWRGSWMKGEGK